MKPLINFRLEREGLRNALRGHSPQEIMQERGSGGEQRRREAVRQGCQGQLGDANGKPGEMKPVV